MFTGLQGCWGERPLGTFKRVSHEVTRAVHMCRVPESLKGKPVQELSAQPDAAMLGPTVTPGISVQRPEMLGPEMLDRWLCRLYSQAHTPDCGHQNWRIMFLWDLLVFTYISLQPVQQPLSAVDTLLWKCLVYVWCRLLGLPLPVSPCSSPV